MKNTLMGTETVPMERFHLVQKLYSFLDIPGAAWDLDLLIYLFCSSRKPSDVRGIRILAGAGADLARAHIIQGRINLKVRSSHSTRPAISTCYARPPRPSARRGRPHPWAERPRQRRLGASAGHCRPGGRPLAEVGPQRCHRPARAGR